MNHPRIFLEHQNYFLDPNSSVIFSNNHRRVVSVHQNTFKTALYFLYVCLCNPFWYCLSIYKHRHVFVDYYSHKDSPLSLQHNQPFNIDLLFGIFFLCNLFNHKKIHYSMSKHSHTFLIALIIHTFVVYWITFIE